MGLSWDDQILIYITHMLYYGGYMVVLLGQKNLPIPATSKTTQCIFTVLFSIKTESSSLGMCIYISR